MLWFFETARKNRLVEIRSNTSCVIFSQACDFPTLADGQMSNGRQERRNGGMKETVISTFSTMQDSSRVRDGRGVSPVFVPSWPMLTRIEPKIMRSRARQAWLHRLGYLQACSSARAFVLSLLMRAALVRMLPTPSTDDVDWEARFAIPSSVPVMFW